MSKANRKAVCVRQVGREVNGTTYCGRAADMYDESDFTFTDPNHALLSMTTKTMKDGQRLEACPDCRKAIAALLSGRIPKVGEDVDDVVQLTRDMLHAGQTGNGGFNRKQIEALGLSYPPKKGWLSELVGETISRERYEKYLALNTDRRVAAGEIKPRKRRLPKAAEDVEQTEQRKSGLG